VCGLVGYAAKTAPVTPERLAAMRDTLIHRGPDDAGLLVRTERSSAMGFGHRRLSIIDTRAVGRQPMSSSDGQLHLVFNGEIYNHLALRGRLQARGHRFTTRTDSEVLLYAYLEWGDALVDELNGMFAFAIWDARRERLLVARDRLGIKPLFWSQLPDGGVLFGSEIKALLAAGCVDDAIDLQSVHDYLGLTYAPGPRTALRGIRKLPAAHLLIWTTQGTTIRRYWEQPLHSVPPVSRPPSYRRAADEVLGEFRQAVRRRMMADVPLGMFLSGGIDSSAVLWAMAEASSRPVKAFTISFDESGYDESDYARVAARAFGAEHHVEVVRPDPDTFIGPLTEILDEPYADSSAIPVWYLSQLARRHVKVALGGDGGDEIYAGYRTHYAWRLANLYRRLPGALRDGLIPAAVDRLPVSHGKVSFDLKARQFVRAAAAPAAQAHFGFKEFLSEDARQALLVRGQPEPTVRLFNEAYGRHAVGHELDGVLYTDTALYLPDDILVKLDRMTMAHGLEARVPFLDHRLVNHAGGLPADYKLRRLRTKAVLKRALAPHLPKQLLERRKAGFNVPMASWLMGPLNGLLRDMLAPERVKRVGLWKPSAVSTLIDEHEGRIRDHSRPLWAMLCFALFNERWRGGRSA
jgi:asparagine synthase (glutamine-hydrolysing)